MIKITTEEITTDVLAATPDAQVCLEYGGGAGGVAGVQYAGDAYRTVVFGFPFETIGTAARAAVMQRIVAFLAPAIDPLEFDFDHDNDVDLDDFQVFAMCLAGPGVTYPAGDPCLDGDGDEDSDVDLVDFADLLPVFTGPGSP